MTRADISRLDGGGRIDETGEIDEEDDDPDRWLWVHCEGSHDGYRDMEWFIEDLDDAEFADKLERAISRGAFRRFKDRLSDRPELMTPWHTFAIDRQRGEGPQVVGGRGLHAGATVGPTNAAARRTRSAWEELPGRVESITSQGMPPRSCSLGGEPGKPFDVSMRAGCEAFENVKACSDPIPGGGRYWV